MCVCVFRSQPVAGGAAGSFLLVLGCPQTPVSGQTWKHVGGMAVDGGQTREQKTFAAPSLSQVGAHEAVPSLC